MVNNDEIVDLGEWFVPKGWDNITLGMFQELQEAFKDGEKFDIRKVLHIFCGKSQEEVDALPVSAAEELLGQLVWLHTDLPKREPTNKITVNGEEYMINTEEEMRTGEFVQVDSILKSNPKDYASILAVLCRKKGERFDSDYEAKLFNERREMYLKVPMLDAMAVMAFFLRLWNFSKLVTQLFLEVQAELSHMHHSIRSSQEIGGFKRRYLSWRMARLRKSLISSNPTYPISYSTSHSSSKKQRLRKRRTSFRNSSESLRNIRNMFTKMKKR